MEVLLNKLFDKHSEGYGVYDRENLIKDICRELQNLQLQQTGVMQRNCKSFGCVDPDNSGQCIYCGKILYND